MKTLGNLVWIVFGGFGAWFSWFVVGCLWCISIIGIPIGKQCFKIAKLSLWPFGKRIVDDGGSGSFLLNILWLIFGGLELCLAHLLSAFILTISIVGIPFAKQSIKLAKISLSPFGKDVI